MEGRFKVDDDTVSPLYHSLVFDHVIDLLR
jgi:hypothetical protein